MYGFAYYFGHLLHAKKKKKRMHGLLICYVRTSLIQTRRVQQKENAFKHFLRAVIPRVFRHSVVCDTNVGPMVVRDLGKPC